jgi:hypothetical protein
VLPLAVLNKPSPLPVWGCRKADAFDGTIRITDMGDVRWQRRHVGVDLYIDQLSRLFQALIEALGLFRLLHRYRPTVR